jgi:hypothetical protein
MDPVIASLLGLLIGLTGLAVAARRSKNQTELQPRRVRADDNRSKRSR